MPFGEGEMSKTKNRKAAVAAVLGILGSAAAEGAQSRTSDWDLLREIVMIPGISSQEAKVMDWLQERLPKGVSAQRDAKNNVWFTTGKGRPHILFVAHADELGMTVESITPQGTVRLRGRGGFLPLACEARPFVIHTAQGPRDGVMLPRADYAARTPQPFQLDPYELDVGADSDAQAKALGIAPGDQVIFKKKIVDIAPGVLAARAVDDRAGCASLLAAALSIDWTSFKGKTVTCAWSVEEEIGLNGAQELAKTIQPDYVFAVDTFVSTDSPLENKRFGYARLGGGAVLRALDSSNLVPKPELLRVLDLAKSKGIPVQIANSRGGNDGSVFVAGGAVDIPLSWPGAHAHSFIEKITRADLEALTGLIRLIITDF
jgi:putative aminopeptidase FrvX